MTKQKIQCNKGTVIYKVEQLIVDRAAVVSCNCVLKNSEENNASDILRIFESRKRFFMLLISTIILYVLAVDFKQDAGFLAESTLLLSEAFVIFTIVFVFIKKGIRRGKN
ncbi:hypothetical protein [Oligella urethralis]|uniref:hypothetical protein n=1 Tax=Oligella urethralis TaxID=90245 RepID=UPI00288914CC|nr:hypothetical protein [Oligella urethralis]